MDSFNAFALLTGLIGGLALFLYGMNVMSGALTKTAGGRLQSLITSVTRNRWLAYFFGIVVTALVQSSSASTVMVVGLVNAGLMTLAQAVNIILGANLGTTFTAWLLSLNAISSDNFFINLLKPTSFTPFLAIVGVALYMFSKSEKKKNIGTIMLGFSVLMFGMNMMSQAVSPLKDVEAFTDTLTRFTNPVLGFLVGVLFTMMIQSSAGTIGVVQALAMSVGISYAVAIPIVVGAEVGTCITAILSSFGASRNGKRTAAMHLSFNVIKALSFLIIFYTLNAFLHFSLLDMPAGMVGVALIHTLVNLVATPLAVPVSGIFVKIAYKLLPVTPQEKEEAAPAHRIQALDDRVLTNSPFAVSQARLAVIDMAQMARDCFLRAVSLKNEYDEQAVEEVRRLEKQIDSYEDQIGSYLVKLNAHHLSPADSGNVSILMYCINDFERISDHALNIMQTYQEMHEKDRHFAERTNEELELLGNAVSEAVTMAVQVFETRDKQLARRVEPLEEVIDELNEVIRNRRIERLRQGHGTIDMGFDVSDLCMNLERIADHTSNIAACVLQIDNNAMGAHRYLEIVRAEHDARFEQYFDEYAEKYGLNAYGKYSRTEGADTGGTEEKGKKTGKSGRGKEKKEKQKKSGKGKQGEKKAKENKIREEKDTSDAGKEAAEAEAAQV